MAVDKAATSSRGLTWRSFIIGIVAAVLINVWLHYAELVLGAERGHSAIANTSIPLGAFNAIFALVAVNLLVTTLVGRPAFRRSELVVIYAMTTVATVLSSSGGLHFLIPTITAAHYFANDTNGWATLFHRFIPSWLAQTNTEALDAFYKGNSVVPFRLWATQIAVWMGFLFTFSCTTLCIVILLRKQWIENEKLPFPTVTLPIELTRDGAPILRDKLFWIAILVVFLIGTLNTAHLNFPNVPQLRIRPYDLSPYILTPPWNAVGFFPIAFFPFAIGIGYLLSTEVVFSCWFFFLVTKAELVATAALGLNENTGSGIQAAFPYLSFQSAGAFLGLALSALWLARRHFKQLIRTAFPKPGDPPDPDSRTNRYALIGLGVCFVLQVGFATMAGARLAVAIAFMLLIFLYLIATTRIRAETGNAWPVGPDVDAFRLMTSALGTHFYTPADLTTLTYLRAATASQDFRGTCMPHQLDAFKMADSSGTNYRDLIWAMILAVIIGVTVSFATALVIWNKFGALAKAEPWRSYHGMQAFSALGAQIRNPQPVDWRGMGGVGVGTIVTWFLAFMRMRYVWWPFHPVGYAMANTYTMANTWMPFLIAWAAKVVIMRAGGLRLYRRAMPVFFGMIAGDFLHGALWTLAACFVDINVYPANW